jgi:hypothetical protein
VSGAGLNDMHLDGLACIVCGRGDDRAYGRPGSVPVGRYSLTPSAPEARGAILKRDGD